MMIKLFALMAFFPSLALANDVAVMVLPNKPIVITADTTDSNGHVVKGPWFSFRTGMINHSQQPVTVVAMKVEVSGSSLIRKDRPEKYRVCTI